MLIDEAVKACHAGACIGAPRLGMAQSGYVGRGSAVELWQGEP